MAPEPLVLLATSQDLPAGEPGGHLLVAALAAHGVAARWVVWDDPAVDWAAASLVVVRSTWDYDGRRPEFLAWARDVETAGTLLTRARVLAWNTDKAYLADLASLGLPCVPTVIARDEDSLLRAVRAYDAAVVKPTVAGGGRGVVLVDARTRGALEADVYGPGPWVVQPLVESVRTEGERSVFVLDGVPGAQVRKVPAADEIRVHEEYGGRSVPVAEPDPVAAALAAGTVSAAEALLDEALPLARVDLMRAADGSWLVSELEVTEPGLYLDVLPGNAEPFAALVAPRVGAAHGPEQRSGRRAGS